jgi:uncharacterized protein YndB with AHSA1/START domain
MPARRYYRTGREEATERGETVGERLEPLRKTIEVEVSAVDAFRIWTEELGDWWPLATHSVGRGDAVSCTLEGRAGGWIYETTRPGDQHVWGTITQWDPPRRLAHSWHPGGHAADATTVELTFRAVGGNRTRLDLVHGGWPASAADRRAEDDKGWDFVLGDCYRAWANRSDARAADRA